MTTARKGGASSVRPSAQGRRKLHPHDLAVIVGAGLISALIVTTGYMAVAKHDAPVEPALGIIEVAPLVDPPATRTLESPRQPYSSPLRPVLGRDSFTLRIPQIGGSWTVKEGVREADIKSNPGHFPGTALPGEIGNVAIAGHRSNAIFKNVHQLRVGHAVVIEAAGERFTYVIYKREVVEPDAMRVVQPNPQHPDRPATRKLLTLVTCLLTGNHRREVIHAALTRQEAITR
jgi:LPXTG-site transpeptidase (sortase) family protein